MQFLDKPIVYEKIKELMISEFELDADSISPDKSLNDDLQLDSLDMVDLILRINDCIGKKVEPTLFKDALIVQDLVNLVYPFWKSE